MSKVNVLVVDDSAVIRDYLVSFLCMDEEIKIVGEADNGKKAIEMVKEFSPDIVIMDIVMPVMSGMEAIEQIMAYNALPILVFTAVEDADIAFKAISKGALDVLSKYELNHVNCDRLINEIKLLSKVKVITHVRSSKDKYISDKNINTSLDFARNEMVVAIASSTGGIRALSKIIPRLPKDFPCPVVIAQHISDGFISGLANWLDKISELKIKVAIDGERIMPGTVYFSNSEKDMMIDKNGRVVYAISGNDAIYHPSCNLLLDSVAAQYGEKSIGVILTGMGNDGVSGMEKIKNVGGHTIAQDESSSVVFGMPGAAIEKGCIDRVLSLEGIKDEITDFVYGNRVLTN